MSAEHDHAKLVEQFEGLAKAVHELRGRVVKLEEQGKSFCRGGLGLCDLIEDLLNRVKTLEGIRTESGEPDSEAAPRHGCAGGGDKRD